MIKRAFTWALVLLAFAGGFAFWRHSRLAAADSLIVYRTAIAQRGDVTQTVAATGTLSAITTVDVGSQVSGQIAKLHADFNSEVKAGELVAEIDPSTYQSRVLQAEADLSSAQATAELKQLNARRAEELLKKELISRADYDQAQTELRQQESAVKVKAAALKSAQVDLERTKIRSPIDGVVISRDIDLGQTVQASFSAPKLFTIAKDLREMQITANVSEADIGGVEPKQNVSFTVDAFPGRTFTGKVREVRNNPTTSSNVVNYSTIIDVANPDMKLRPGMTANVTITIARRADAVRVPNSALRFRPPEGAAVIPQPETGEAAKTGPAEGGGPKLDRMPPEMRDRMLADFDKNKDGDLDTDERKVMREQMQARRAAGGPGGSGPGGGVIFRSGDGTGPADGGATVRPRQTIVGPQQIRTVYALAGESDASGRASGVLTAIKVRAGLSDSSHTEIVSGLEDGAVVAIGVSTASTEPTTNATTTNPFAPRPPRSKAR